LWEAGGASDREFGSGIHAETWARLNGLHEGQKITYEIQQDRGKETTVNLKARSHSGDRLTAAPLKPFPICGNRWRKTEDARTRCGRPLKLFLVTGWLGKAIVIGHAWQAADLTHGGRGGARSSIWCSA
jgi:hypothetical protein